MSKGTIRTYFDIEIDGVEGAAPPPCHTTVLIAHCFITENYECTVHAEHPEIEETCEQKGFLAKVHTCHLNPVIWALIAPHRGVQDHLRQMMRFRCLVVTVAVDSAHIAENGWMLTPTIHLRRKLTQCLRSHFRLLDCLCGVRRAARDVQRVACGS
jgi:hypothetical protein